MEDNNKLTFPKWAYRKQIFWLMVIVVAMWYSAGTPFMMTLFLVNIGVSFFLNSILFLLIYGLKQSKRNKQNENKRKY